ncbi:MAG: MBL fold metallo-hydrolase [Pseudomonadota bacterium]
MIIRIGRWLAATIVLLVVVSCAVVLLRPGMSDVGIPYAPQATNDAAVKVRWLGVATLLIDDGETQILTDGFVSRPSAIDLLLQRPIAPDINAIKQFVQTQQLNRLAAIMPVHSHFDHAMDSADIAKLTGAELLGSSTTANIAASSALNPAQVKVVQPGVAYDYGKFAVTFYESRHAPLASNSGIEGTVDEPFSLPAPYTAWKEGKSYAIHVAHPEGSLLIQGSAGFVNDALKNVKADVLFLGTGGLKDLSYEYLESYIAETAGWVQPSTVISIHHDNLLGDFGDVEQSKLLLSFDQTFAFSLQQMVQPAKLLQLPFGVDMPVIKK